MDFRLLKEQMIADLKATIRTLNEFVQEDISIFEEGAARELIPIFTNKLNTQENSEKQINRITLQGGPNN